MVAQCAGCHGDGVFRGKPVECESCHRTEYEQSTDPNHSQAGYPLACATCHSTSRWEDATFDHDRSRFPLTGAHVTTDCASCHGDGVYEDKSTACADCHQPDYDATDDPSHASAGFSSACADCHNTSQWSGAVFDHNKTDFPLRGAHASVDCASCHGDNVFHDRSADCASCHREDYDGATQPDHAGAGYPLACATCHNTTSWQDATFNHQQTNFPLTGAHAAAQCASCHGDNIYDGKSGDCFSCHRPQYEATTSPSHTAADFGTDCATCHDTGQWAGARFDHNARTSFPLTGAHTTAQCASCHGDNIFDGKSSDCATCHRSDYNATTNPNHSQAGYPLDCAGCHDTVRWQNGAFDHSRTSFPLTGAHQAAQCASCHGDNIFDGKSTDCASCHRTDYDGTTDPNHVAAGFQQTCATCHNTTRWEDATFNHDTQTSFPLTGAHIAAQCASCHGDGIYNGKSTDCASCHRTDYDGTTDPNHAAAGFPQTCATCHNTTRWEDATFNHDTQTSFPLTGAHIAAQCASCHGDGIYNGKSTDCASCHRTDYDGTTDPNHAAAGFPQTCATCHNTTQWEDATFNHDTQTSFPLTGSHIAAQCASCHGDGIYNGKSTDCYSCHQPKYAQTSDPPHASAGFGTNCATCHNTTRWEDATFNHDTQTSFPLTGAHIAAQCASCHGDGIYNGKSTDCASCHLSDYQATSDPNHVAAGFPQTCATCHNTTRWEDGTFNHDTQTSFPLTGAHLAATCGSCHGDAIYNGKSTDCASCHLSDYQGTTSPNHVASGFPQTCATCHNTTRWEDGTFNHSTQTSFPLTGAHLAATCGSCHGDGVYNGKSTDCASCHLSDYQATSDPNHVAAGFPQTCATCHNTTRWEDGTFNHSTQTSFPLTGAHIAAQCASCHGDGVYNGKSTDCASCHLSDYQGTTDPNHVSAGFPQTCATCHNTTRWDDGTFNHSTQTSFPLTGAHIAAQCASCHGDGVYNGKSTDCASCHLADYQGTTSPNHAAAGFPQTCATCHGTTQWAGATFNHSTQTSFPLTGAHIAAQCASCHGDGVYDGKSTACASCHLADYQATTDPHHGPAGFSTNCATCHTTTQWDGGTFNHSTGTSFPLTGAHLTVDCASCHGDAVYNGKSTDCASCHLTDYQGTTSPNHVASGFPQTCATCHNTTRWEDATFNHNNTSFPLTGAHIAAQCASCHGDGVYNGKSTDCASCHLSDYQGTTDPNHVSASFPQTCATCHNTTRWEDGTFNHSTGTSFPLTGAHIAAQCASCHGDGVYNGKSTDCASCHLADYQGTTSPNHAAAGFPQTCATCHGTTQWAGATFNHSTQTSFPLTGAHIAAQCASCHGDGVYNGKSTDCASCHLSDYQGTTDPNHVSAGFPQTCATCHNTTRWEDGTFNHSTQTSFPLTGAHLAATCASCHGDGVYNGKSTDCASCHLSDYQGTTSPNHVSAGFPQTCNTCHNTTRWEDATFNHSNTSFPLTGAHLAATCGSCHGDGVYDGKSTACSSCHLADYQATNDPHHGPAGFSTNCATCHNTTQWDGGTFNHSTGTSFPLTGAHVALNCASCHGDAIYNGKSTACVACHLSDYQGTTDPNHATAGFPQTCNTCHTTTQWDGATFNHDSSWFPIYSGNHLGRWDTCSDCHNNSGNFAVFTCLSCHPHSDKAGTDADHQGRSGYSYTSTACYSCHPRGNS